MSKASVPVSFPHCQRNWSLACAIWDLDINQLTRMPAFRATSGLMPPVPGAKVCVRLTLLHVKQHEGQLQQCKFASASCRKASGTSRPGSGLLPPNPTFFPVQSFVTPPPPLSVGPLPIAFGAAANRCRGGSCLSTAPTLRPTPPPPHLPHPHPEPPKSTAPSRPIAVISTLHAVLGQPGCRGGARKRLQLQVRPRRQLFGRGFSGVCCVCSTKSSSMQL